MRAIHVYHGGSTELCEAVASRAPGRTIVSWGSPDDMARGIGEAEVVFASIPPRTGWAKASMLRLVQMMGAGVDGLLPSPDLPRAVTVAGARGLFASEAAEHAIAMMLSLARGLPQTFERQRLRTWKQVPVERLAGSTVVIVGLGEIGSRIAKAANALGMRVLGVRRSAGPSLDELLPEAQWLVLCVPLTRDTNRLLDARAIARLPDRARIVSLGRGRVIDEPALREALEAGRIAGAALDVFADEPLPPEHAWWSVPNTIVTSHVAGLGRGYVERMIALLLENVRRLEADEPLVGVVDRALGY